MKPRLATPKLDNTHRCVKMYNIMRKATIRQMQHNLSEVLSWVEGGEEVEVLRRNKVVARLVPAAPRRTEMPDFVGRARAVWGEKPRGAALSEISSEARGER